MKPPKGRNPIARELRDPKFRKKIAKSGKDREEQSDPFSKKAKHKKPALEESPIFVDTSSQVILEKATGTKMCDYHVSEGKIILDFGDCTYTARTIKEAANHLVHLLDQAKPVQKETCNSLNEFYQVGDKVKVTDGPLKKVLDRAEKLRKTKQAEKGVEPGDKVEKDSAPEAVVREPNGPADTIGITIDGEYHLVDEEDVELIVEAFDYVELSEWSYAETSSGIRVPVSGEEQEILTMCSAPVYKTNMEPREQEVARRMVSRGVLHRQKDDEGIYFVRDSQKLTRF